MFTVAVRSVKQFRIHSTPETLLNDSAELQLYDSEFQTDGTLTLKAFADDAIVSSVVQTVTVYQLIAECEMLYNYNIPVKLPFSDNVYELLTTT